MSTNWGKQYWGKNVKFVDTDNKVWRGYVSGIESPQDSDDGNWWLDIDVDDPKFDTGLSISKKEIKSIDVLD